MPPRDLVRGGQNIDRGVPLRERGRTSMIFSLTIHLTSILRPNIHATSISTKIYTFDPYLLIYMLFEPGPIWA